MEILDKSKIELIKTHYNNSKENFLNIFKKKPKESVGIYLTNEYIYMVICFCEANQWHLLSVEKEKLPPQNIYEFAANWTYDKINENNLTNAVISLDVPDNFLLKNELELKNIYTENIKETIYWDFVQTHFKNNQEFNIAYYPLDDGLYYAAALEVKNQKYINNFFKNKEIYISNWTTFPETFQLETNINNISIFNVKVNVPINIDILNLSEYTPAIYSAMNGAELFKDEQNINFPSLCQKDIWNYKLLALTLLFAFVFIISIIFVYDNYKIYSLQNKLENVNAELKNLSQDKTKIKIYNDILKDTKVREKIMAKKTKERLPFQGILLHLGTLTEDGVVLKSVKSDKAKIIIEGEAISEECMERFLNQINREKDIFIKSPKSFKYENKNKILFSFSIDL